jgi:hypothetical protein
MWLKFHNWLYTSLDFDKELVDLYPDDGPLPGIDQGIMYHQVTSTEAVELFHEETAGIEDYPALFAVGKHLDDHSDCAPEPLVKKMGVMDPECTHISAQSLIANALYQFAHTDDDGNELPFQSTTIPCSYQKCISLSIHLELVDLRIRLDLCPLALSNKLNTISIYLINLFVITCCTSLLYST